MQLAVASVFWIFAITSLACGWAAGNDRDRLAILSIFISLLLTLAFWQIFNPVYFVPLTLLIDVFLLISVIYHAMKSDRFWSLWFSAFVFAGILSSISSQIAGAEYSILRLFSGFWAIPALLVMAIGLRMDRSAARQRSQS